MHSCAYSETSIHQASPSTNTAGVYSEIPHPPSHCQGHQPTLIQDTPFFSMPLNPSHISKSKQESWGPSFPNVSAQPWYYTNLDFQINCIHHNIIPQGCFGRYDSVVLWSMVWNLQYDNSTILYRYHKFLPSTVPVLYDTNRVLRTDAGSIFHWIYYCQFKVTVSTYSTCWIKFCPSISVTSFDGS